MMFRRSVLLAITTALMAAIPVPASAQQTSAIAGVVRDSSGGVLPGVQVETASPALIEKVRTAFTDEAGRYNIVELRPGTYTVTFTLSGFRTVRREGLELSSGFTATANAEMELGGIEESVTVSGASPLVDVQNTRNQTRVDEKLLAVLPSGNKGVTSLLTLTPGVTGASDVGGSLGVYRSMGAPQFITFHGRTGMKIYYDGMDVLNISGNGFTGFIINSQNVSEMALESSGVSAESASSGFSSNAIPKDGGNRFESSASFLYSTEAMNSTNLSDEMRGRGLTTTERVLNLRDLGAVVSGPIFQDRAWFLGSVRDADNRNQKPGIFFNSTPGTPFYTPDPSRAAFRHETFWSASGRVTVQASPRNKISGFYEAQHLCGCPRDGLFSPEADTGLDFYPQWLAQATWSSPVTSRLLLQAGYSYARDEYYSWGPETTPQEAISIFEISNGFTYNNRPSWATIDPSDRAVQRFSASYVTGTHSFKTGVLLEQMALGTTNFVNDFKVGFQGEEYGNVSYRFLNRVPNGVTQYATPTDSLNRMKTFGAFAQDQWVLDRLTLNFGLRFDYFNGRVPAQSAPAGVYVPAREFAEVKNVPNWTDLSPRVGGVYDLFGNGRTAVKAYVGRYVTQEASTITSANNPFTTSVSSTTRTWNDLLYPAGDPRRGNFVPDCDLTNSLGNGECGPFANQNFGRINPNATRYDASVLEGFGVRPASWDYTTELQQQIGAGISVSAGYYHTKLVNFRATDNLLVTPADFSPYCVTAPVHSELPDGGGYRVCGLADVAPALFGRVLNLVTDAANFGEAKQSSDFFAVNFRARLGDNQFGGGVDTGRTVRDLCFVVDSPQELLNCRVVTSFAAQTQVKLFGTFMVPGEIQLSGTFQSYPGATYLANYNAPNSLIASSLGRNLAACGAQVVCNSTAVVPLIAPETAYEARRTQLDLRISRTFALGGRLRLQANLDVYNVLNDGSLLSPNGVFGPQWRLPAPPGSVTASGSGLLVGRLGQISGQITF